MARVSPKAGRIRIRTRMTLVRNAVESRPARQAAENPGVERRRGDGEHDRPQDRREERLERQRGGDRQDADDDRGQHPVDRETARIAALLSAFPAMDRPLRAQPGRPPRPGNSESADASVPLLAGDPEPGRDRHPVQVEDDDRRPGAVVEGEGDAVGIERGRHEPRVAAAGRGRCASPSVWRRLPPPAPARPAL